MVHLGKYLQILLLTKGVNGENVEKSLDTIMRKLATVSKLHK